MDGYHDIRELKLMTRVAFQIGVVLRLFFGTTGFLAMSVAGAGTATLTGLVLFKVPGKVSFEKHHC